jgi:tRNA(adenine34) deaminase
MNAVIEMAEECRNGEVPVAAAIVFEGKIVAISTNDVETSGIPWRHAEFVAISEALKKLGVRYLDKASLYVTLEPCAFCSAAIEKVRMRDIFFGAYDTKCGAIAHTIRLFDHSMVKPRIIGGIQEERCSSILRKFFGKMRSTGKRNVIEDEVEQSFDDAWSVLEAGSR